MLYFAVSALSAFFMSPFIINSVGDRMYGSWLCVAAFIGYYGLLDFGLSTAVNRYLSVALGENDDSTCNRVFNTALFLFSGIGLAVLVLTGIISCLVPFFISAPDEVILFRKLILILGLSSAVGFPARAFLGVLISQLRYKLLSLLQIMTLVIRTACIAIALLLGYKILAMAWITLLSWVPEALCTVYFTRKGMPGLSFFDIRLWNGTTARSLFSYSAFTFATQIGDILRFNVDVLVITSFVGLAAVTHYNIAATLGKYFLDLMIAVMGIFQPVFSRQHGAKEFDALHATFLATSKISLYVASFFGFSLIAFGKPFILRWMGTRFVDAYPCLVLLILAWLCDLTQMPSVSLLFAISKHRFYALFNSIEALANLALSLVLVRHYGILGVALGTFIPMAIMKLIIQPVYMCRVSGVAYGDYFRLVGRNLTVILTSLSVPLYLALRYATPNYLVLSSSVALLFVYYGAIVWMIGLTRAERDTLLSALRRRNKSPLLADSLTV